MERIERSDSPLFDRLDRSTRGLSPSGLRIARAFAEAMFADEDEDGTLVAASDDVCTRATDWLDRAVGAASTDIHRGLFVLVWVLELLPLFVTGAFSRMSRLPLQARIEYLEALERSRFGLLTMLLIAFKVPMTIAVFEEGAELASTGFDRPSLIANRRLGSGSLARVRGAS